MTDIEILSISGGALLRKVSSSFELILFSSVPCFLDAIASPLALRACFVDLVCWKFLGIRWLSKHVLNQVVVS